MFNVIKRFFTPTTKPVVTERKPYVSEEVERQMFQDLGELFRRNPELAQYVSEYVKAGDMDFAYDILDYHYKEWIHEGYH